MAIADVLYGFNPMDIVRGYEYGVGKGIEREKGEEEIKRQKIVNELASLRDKPAATLAGMRSQLDIDALGARTAEERDRRISELDIGISKTGRSALEEGRLSRTAPGRQGRLEALDIEGTSPDAIAKDIEGQRAGREGRAGAAKYGASTYAALEEENQAALEVRGAFDQGAAEEREAMRADPTAARVDEWTRSDRALGRVKSARAQELILRRRDEQALQEMKVAGRSGNATVVNTYLKRYGMDADATLVTVRDPATGQPVTAWNVQDMQTIRNQDGSTARTPTGAVRSYTLDGIAGVLGIAERQAAPARRAAAPRAVAPRVQPAAPNKPEANMSVSEAAVRATGPAEDEGAKKRRDAIDKITAKPGSARPSEKLRAIADSITALTREEQETYRHVKTAADKLRAELASEIGNTDTNRVLFKSYADKVDEMIARGQDRRAKVAR